MIALSGDRLYFTVAKVSGRNDFRNNCVEDNAKVNQDGTTCFQLAVDAARRHFYDNMSCT